MDGLGLPEWSSAADRGEYSPMLSGLRGIRTFAGPGAGHACGAKYKNKI